MYNFSIGGNSKKDPYNFALGGSSAGEPKKGFGLTGALSKNGGLSGGLSSNLVSSQTKSASSSYTSGFGGGFGNTKSIMEASKSTQAATKASSSTSSAAASKSSKAQPSKKGAKSKFGENIVPKRFGIKYDPPTITLEYMEPNSGKLYHHKMKMKKLQKDTDIKDAIEYLRKKHETYLSDDSITDDQLKSLIKRLQDHLRNAKQSSKDKGGKASDPPKKSNSLTPLTNNDFQRGTSLTKTNSTTDNGGTIKYSNAFSSKNAAASSSIYGSKPSYLKGGRDEDEEEEEDVFKYAWSKKGAGSIQASKIAQQDEYDYYNDEDEEEEEEEEVDEDEEDDDAYNKYGKIDYSTFNLNKLSNDELQKHKDRMEVQFKKNNLKPGDKGYQYDVEEDFDPDESNEWDEDI